MDIWEAALLLLSLFAVFGLYFLICLLCRAMSKKDPITPGIKVSDGEFELLHERLRAAQISVGGAVGFDPIPVILLERRPDDKTLEEMYIEYGETDIYLKLTPPKG